MQRKRTATDSRFGVHNGTADALEAAMFRTPDQGNLVRIGIVGVGHVGATTAYALLLSGLAAELVLIDQDPRRADGESMDLNHAVPFTHPTRVWAGGYADLSGALLTVIAAGVGQRPGETRLDLLQRNADVFQEIIPQIVAHNPNGILLVATNPVDVLSYLAWKLSGRPAQQVIGSGTILDTARFRYLLSEHYGVDARSVHAHIIGEHGDSEIPVWSLANIAGVQIRTYVAAQGSTYDDAAMQRTFERTRDAAYEIIRGKGATYYAVAAGLVRIVESIVRNQHTILSVSNLVDDAYGISDVYLSLPAVIGRAGVERTIRLPLDESETAGLRHSADVLKASTHQLRFRVP